jgi:hypothetical protein
MTTRGATPSQDDRGSFDRGFELDLAVDGAVGALLRAEKRDRTIRTHGKLNYRSAGLLSSLRCMWFGVVAALWIKRCSFSVERGCYPLAKVLRFSHQIIKVPQSLPERGGFQRIHGDRRLSVQSPLRKYQMGSH